MKDLLEKQELSVLIVDKDADLRKSIVRILAQLSSDVSIQESNSAQEAYEILSGETFDIAILGQELPDELGSDLLGRIKQEHHFQTPIIMLVDSEELGEEVIKLGAEEFLFRDRTNLTELKKSIRHCLQRHHLWMELQHSKAREQRERELRLLEEADRRGPETELQEQIPKSVLDEFCKEYESIFRVFTADHSYKRSPEAPEQIRLMAHRLGLLGAGPKDLVNIHRTVLADAVKNKATKREDALVNEFRYLLLQLMGELLLFYRDRQSSQDQKSGTFN